jgi:hypothetical protein
LTIVGAAGALDGLVDILAWYRYLQELKEVGDQAEDTGVRLSKFHLHHVRLVSDLSSRRWAKRVPTSQVIRLRVFDCAARTVVQFPCQSACFEKWWADSGIGDHQVAEGFDAANAAALAPFGIRPTAF